MGQLHVEVRNGFESCNSLEALKARPIPAQGGRPQRAVFCSLGKAALGTWHWNGLSAEGATYNQRDGTNARCLWDWGWDRSRLQRSDLRDAYNL